MKKSSNQKTGNSLKIGENAIAFSVSYPMTVDCVKRIDHLYQHVLEQEFPGLVSIRRGLDSLVIEHEDDFDSAILLEMLDNSLRKFDNVSVEPVEKQILRIPVCYESNYGRDLPKLAETCGLAVDDITRLHYSSCYEVWMIGFMPGFPYMGRLPEPLQVKRKLTPETMIPSGSVAIAEEYVGIYPFDSPGGWHIIGRIPWSIIDYSKPKPCLFDYGMRVQFYPISSKEFETMKKVVT